MVVPFNNRNHNHFQTAIEGAIIYKPFGFVLVDHCGPFSINRFPLNLIMLIMVVPLTDLSLIYPIDGDPGEIAADDETPQSVSVCHIEAEAENGKK